MRIVITGIPGREPIVFEGVRATIISAILEGSDDKTALFILGNQSPRDAMAIATAAAVLGDTPYELRASRATYLRDQALEHATVVEMESPA